LPLRALLLLRPLCRWLLPLALLLLWLAWCASRGGRHRAMRHARRMVAELSALTGSERLELRHIGARSDHVLSLPRRHWPANGGAA